MIILGIDPGIARVGWAVLDVQGPKILLVACDCIETAKTIPTDQRLLIINTKLHALLKTYTPRCVSVEELFFASNAKTAIVVGEARGVILLTAAQANIPVVSYTPLMVKRTITGDGRADKKQVEHMILQILHMKLTPKLDDTTDAIAIALTHAYTYKWKEKTT